MFGLLNVDKPPGITSRDLVNRVQRLVKPHKVGHAGTLDPLASGVLVVAIGPATRLVEYIQRKPKEYRGTFLLGRTSDTEDVEGEVRELPEAAAPTEEQIRAVLPRFVGRIEQRPPAYSALKIGGRRAYELARRGGAAELAPRPVEVYELQIVGYRFPELELAIRCGSGTYVRSLGRDIARAVGSDAVMSSLRREAIGDFRVLEAVPGDEISFPVVCDRLLPAVRALAEMPRMEVNAEEMSRLAKGQAIGNRWAMAAEEVAALDGSGQLMAILVPAGGDMLRPEKCFIGQS